MRLTGRAAWPSPWSDAVCRLTDSAAVDCVQQDSHSGAVRPCTLSITFNINVEFDTGQKLPTSAVSRPGFFNSGETMACFWSTGSWPCESDALTSATTYGASTSTNSRNRNVGTGSSEHDLTGDDMMI